MADDVTVKIGADGTIANAEIKSVEKNVDKLANSTSASMARVGQAFMGAKSMITTASSGIETALNFLKQPILLAASFDDISVSLRHMTGDAEGVRDVLDEIRSISNDTGFKSLGMAQEIDRMVRAGFSLREAMHNLKTAAVLSEGDGEVMAGILGRLVQAKSNGRGATEETLSIFKDRGLPVANEIRSYLGVTVREFRKMLEEGLDVSVVIAALDRLADRGQAKFDELNQGLNSSLDATAASWENAMALFGEGLLNGVLPIVQDLNGALAESQPLAQQMGKNLGEALTNAYQYLKDNSEAVTETAKKWGELALSATQALTKIDEFFEEYYGLKYPISWIDNTVSEVVLGSSPHARAEYQKEALRRWQEYQKSEGKTTQPPATQGHTKAPQAQAVPTSSTYEDQRKKDSDNLESLLNSASETETDLRLQTLKKSLENLAETWKGDAEMAARIAEVQKQALPIAERTVAAAKARLAAAEASKKAEANMKTYLREKEKYEENSKYQDYDLLGQLREKKNFVAGRASAYGVEATPEAVTVEMNRLGSVAHDDATARKIANLGKLRDLLIQIRKEEEKQNQSRALRDNAEQRKLALLEAQAAGDQRRAARLTFEAALVDRVNAKLAEGLTLKQAQAEAAREMDLESKIALREAKKQQQYSLYAQTDYSSGRGTQGVLLPQYNPAMTEARKQTAYQKQIVDLLQRQQYSPTLNAVMVK